MGRIHLYTLTIDTFVDLLLRGGPTQVPQLVGTGWDGLMRCFACHGSRCASAYA